MKYLEGEKAVLLGLSHTEYIRYTENVLKGNYNPNNTTKYRHDILKHPEKEEYVLCVGDDNLFETKDKNKMKTKAQIEGYGWFNQPVI